MSEQTMSKISKASKSADPIDAIINAEPTPATDPVIYAAFKGAVEAIEKRMNQKMGNIEEPKALENHNLEAEKIKRIHYDIAFREAKKSALQGNETNMKSIQAIEAIANAPNPANDHILNLTFKNQLALQPASSTNRAMSEDERLTVFMEGAFERLMRHKDDPSPQTDFMRMVIAAEENAAKMRQEGQKHTKTVPVQVPSVNKLPLNEKAIER